MIIEVNSEAEMKDFGSRLGSLFSGGEVLELVGDVGAGKTTLTKGIGEGLKIDEAIQSPSFTISRLYEGHNNLLLAHYDFYRLHDAGIMTHDLSESINDPRVVTVIEWAEIVKGVVPPEYLRIDIITPSESARRLDIHAKGERYLRLLEKLG